MFNSNKGLIIMKEDVNMLNLYLLLLKSTSQWHQNCLRFLNMPITEHPHASLPDFSDSALAGAVHLFPEAFQLTVKYVLV